MNGTNHIAGGLLFTGIFASFWNINIFSDAGLIGLTVLGSVLPDIDHTKSPIGKVFWPLSRYLDTRYGHRTITHSLLFLLGLTLFSYLIQRLACPSYPITLILFFSAFSHLILDMITIAGIPLFYPFVKNPCVIPGNPNFRLESGNFRTEAIAFVIFGSLLFTCNDLFANGFWTSYNRAFGTLKHLNIESKNTSDFLLVHYDIINNGVHDVDTALLIKSSETKATLYDKGGLIELDEAKSNQHINDLKPIHTRIKYKIVTVNEIYTANDMDKIDSILRNRIITGYIRSNKPFFYHSNGIAEKKNSISLNTVQSPKISLFIDSSNTELRQQLKQLNIKIKKDIADWQSEEKEWRNSIVRLGTLKQILKNTTDHYERNDIETQIIELQKKLHGSTGPKYVPDPIKMSQIDHLAAKMSLPSDQTFHVNIQYPEIPAQYGYNSQHE